MNDTTTSLEALVTRHRDIKSKRSILSAQEKELGAELKRIEGQLIREMREMGVDGLKVSGCSLAVSTKPSTKVTDLATFATWCVENGQTNVLYKSAIAGEVEKLTVEGMVPPGVTLSHYDKISIRNSE